MNMDDINREHGRLAILKLLNDEPDGRSNSSAISDFLQEKIGIARSRSWVHEELRWLAEVGAVTITDMGAVRIAEITAKGRDHAERRIVIEGVKRPSPRD